MKSENKKQSSIYVITLFGILLTIFLIYSCSTDEYNYTNETATKVNSIAQTRSLVSQTWNTGNVLIDSVANSDEFYEFERCSEQLADKFSAYTCIFFGFFGSIFAIVNILGFIDLIPALFSQIVLLFVFIAFLIGGIIMYINSKSIEQNAATEETLEKELNEWLDMNITESYVYQLKDDSSSDEINYFRYFEAIKQDVLKDFPEAPAAMIDALIDEHLNSLV